MGLVELFFIAAGLSMDAFAVSICKGLGMQKVDVRRAAVIAVFFGGFQAAMPLVGWALGTQFEHYITGIDHWIAFILLGGIGAKMLWDAFHEDGGECCDEGALDIRELTMLAIATSIDALAVGITFAFLKVEILPAVALIGAVTFVLSFVGVALGNRLGSSFRKKATIAGGIVLVLIGAKIFLDHMGLLPW